MSIRQAITIVVLVGVVQIGTELYGGQFFLWYLIIIGGLGLAGTLAYALRLRRLQRYLATLDESKQDEVLVAIEGAAERRALAEELGRPQPIVPIRDGREVFRYPGEHVLVTKGIMYGCIFIAGIAVVGWASDALLGRTRFVDPATTPWWEMGLLIGGFSVGALLMRWMVEATVGQLEISEEGVMYRVHGKAVRIVTWQDLTEAGISPMSDVLWVRSRRTKIAVSNKLVSFGRAVNLVASRAAARSKWKTG